MQGESGSAEGFHSVLLTSADGSTSAEFVPAAPFAQVFAPSGQQFICFEPMTAPANALNSGDGLTVLAPGDSHRAAFRISLSRGD